MRIAYFDCFHGAAGDMLLAALLDAGLELDVLRAGLAGLGLSGYSIEPRRVVHHGVAGTQLRVIETETQPPRDWNAIRELISSAPLPGAARGWALGAFERLARAEAAIHGVPIEHVHFHEVGAIDSIVDTVGVCVGLALLGVEQVYASPVPLGRGWVHTSHGPLPVPAPATLAVLADVGAPTLPAPPDSDGELITPTAASLLAELATFAQPPLRITRVGYGLGQKEFARLNGLRVWLGEGLGADHRPPIVEHNHAHMHPTGMEPSDHEALCELRCNLDDATGELVAYVIERLLAAGALDAWAVPLVMKKGRPALQLACLARHAQTAALAALILGETPTLGVRWSPVERVATGRDWVVAATPWGTVRVKRKLLDGKPAGAAPEYEDCASLARAHGVPLAQVYAMALAALDPGLLPGAPPLPRQPPL